MLFLEEPISVEGTQKEKLDLEIFNFDPSLTPPAKRSSNPFSIQTMTTGCNYPPTNKTTNRKNRKSPISSLKQEKRFPGFKSKVEATEVVTPVSVEHWTAAYRGCQAWGAPKEYIKEVNKNGVSKSFQGLATFTWLDNGQSAPLA